MAVYIKALEPAVETEGFLVNNEEENAQEIDGVPICHIDGNADIHTAYPAFIAERLLSLFFEINRNRYNIVYCDKNFLN